MPTSRRNSARLVLGEAGEFGLDLPAQHDRRPAFGARNRAHGRRRTAPACRSAARRRLRHRAAASRSAGTILRATCASSEPGSKLRAGRPCFERVGQALRRLEMCAHRRDRRAPRAPASRSACASSQGRRAPVRSRRSRNRASDPDRPRRASRRRLSKQRTTIAIASVSRI